MELPPVVSRRISRSRALRIIFKAQRTSRLYPGAEPEILIYNQDKSVVFQGPVHANRLGKLFPKSKDEVFQYGYFDNGVVTLTGKAPEQEW